MKDRKSYLVDIRCNTEADGQLYVAESNGNPIPFDIKRVFWVCNVVPGARRGEHATRETKLILVPVAGSCDVEVDDGSSKKVYHMDSATKGLYIDEMIYRTMFNFTPDCVMLALCDRPYTPGNETYEDYDEFIKALNEME